MTGKQSSICAQLNDCAAKTIAMNRMNLKSIIETIILCAKQNIPCYLCLYLQILNKININW